MNLLKLFFIFSFLIGLLQVQAQTIEATITTETSFKSEGSFESKTISRIFQNDKVIFLNDCNYFYCKVEFNGKIGWVKKQLIDKTPLAERQLQKEENTITEKTESNLNEEIANSTEAITNLKEEPKEEIVNSTEAITNLKEEPKEEIANSTEAVANLKEEPKEEIVNSIEDTGKSSWEYEKGLTGNNSSGLLYGIIFAGVLLICRLGYLFYKLFLKNQKTEIAFESLKLKYQGIINVDEELEKRKSEVDAVEKSRNELRSKYHSEKEVYDKLIHESNQLKDDLDMAEFGVFEPQFDKNISKNFKLKIKEVQDKQKRMITNDEAIVGGEDLKVNGSIQKGRVIIDMQKKLMLRAFNGECVNIIKNVKWDNESQMEERILKSAETINKIGEAQGLEISPRFSFFKILELKTTHEFVVKKNEEKGIQRRTKKI